MTDTKDLCEEWVAKNIHKEFTPIDIEDVYKSFDGAWQARGELDAVKIKELEADLDDRKREVNLRCGQIQERDIRIAELTAKLDKAREALGKILVGYADKNNVEAISTKALQELDK